MVIQAQEVNKRAYCSFYPWGFNIKFSCMPGVSNRTKSSKTRSNPITEHQSFDRVGNIYSAVSSISEPIQAGEQNRTQPNNPFLFCSESISRRGNHNQHNQPFLNGINRKTTKYPFGFFPLSTFLFGFIEN